MRNPLLIVCIFSVLIILSSCEKKDCKEKGNCPPENYKFELGEAKNYLVGNKGSYWIYKNTKTGDLDTQTCTGYKIHNLIIRGSKSYSKHITVNYEKLTRSIYSSYSRWNCSDKTIDPAPDENGFNGNYRIVLNRHVELQGVNYPFFYPLVLNAWAGSGNSNTYCTIADTSLAVSGYSYDKVSVFDIDIDEIWEEKNNCIRPNTVYYWAKDVGLIRKDMNRCNYSWELIEYKILP